MPNADRRPSTEKATDTPRTDAQVWVVKEGGFIKGDYIKGETEVVAASVARQIERDLEICRDAHMANCLAADTLRTEIRALRAELFQSKAPVIGECEDCGHKIVTPLGRLP